MSRISATANGRILQYTAHGCDVAIARIGRRWFLSVGPSGKVRDSKDGRMVDPHCSAKTSLEAVLEFTHDRNAYERRKGLAK